MTNTLTIIAFLAMLAVVILGGARLAIKNYDEWRNAQNRSPVRDWRKDEWWK